MSTQESSHPATAAHRERARQRGDVAVSRELSAVVTLLAATVLLSVFARPIWVCLGNFATECWSSEANEPNDQKLDGSRAVVSSIRGDSLVDSGRLWCEAGGLFAAVLIIAFAIGWLQVGGGLFWSRLRLDWGRLGPAHWAARRDNSDAKATRTLLGVVRWLALIATVGWSLWSDRLDLMRLSTVPATDLVDAAAGLLMSILLKTLAVLVVFGLIDLALERFCYSRRLQMSDEEMRRRCARRRWIRTLSIVSDKPACAPVRHSPGINIRTPFDSRTIAD